MALIYPNLCAALDWVPSADRVRAEVRLLFWIWFVVWKPDSIFASLRMAPGGPGTALGRAPSFYQKDVGFPCCRCWSSTRPFGGLIRGTVSPFQNRSPK